MRIYTDFLRDNRFLRWQLAPDDELNAFWDDFRKTHPHLENELQKAIVYLKTEVLNPSSLSDDERMTMLLNVQKIISGKKRSRRRRMVLYSVVSSVAIVLVVFGIALFSKQHPSQTPQVDEHIVGKLLNSEDIRFITGNQTRTFHDDVELVVNASGNVTVTNKNSEKEDLKIEKEKMNSLVVPYGKRSTLLLSDGTKVWLNSGSVLEFPTKFFGDKREIRLLSGEIYVEVSPDDTSLFTVATDIFDVQVHGTKFNITHYEDSPDAVVLVEGSVSLRSAGTKELFMIPNQQATFKGDKKFDIITVEAERHVSWKDGYLTFHKTPMTEVLNQIGRYYNLSFNFDGEGNLGKRTCTGKIYLSENLDNVMTTLTILSSTSYKREDNQILIINEQKQPPMKK